MGNKKGNKEDACFLLLVNGVGQGALTAGLAPVLVLGHEDAGTALGVGALVQVGLDLEGVVLTVTGHGVELEDAHGHQLVAVDGLLGLGEDLLLLLLTLTSANGGNALDGGLGGHAHLDDALVLEELTGAEQVNVGLTDAGLEGLNGLVGVGGNTQGVARQ